MRFCIAGESCIVCSQARKDLGVYANSYRLTRYEEAFDAGLDPHSFDCSMVWSCNSCHGVTYQNFWQYVKNTAVCPMCRKAGGEENLRNFPSGTAFKSNQNINRFESRTEALAKTLLQEQGLVKLNEDAVTVKSPFYGKFFVSPDMLYAHRVALEIDAPGSLWRDSHCGPENFRKDRWKTLCLKEVGWSLIRVRLGGLPAIPDCVNLLFMESRLTPETAKDVAIRIYNAQLRNLNAL